MCGQCWGEDFDPYGCIEYGHEYVDCSKDCGDPLCDLRVCIYCADSY